jgi:hypothetical protein
VGDLPFFYTGTVDEAVECAIDLALIYHCDPFLFLQRPSHEVFTLYKMTQQRLREAQRD